MKRYEIIGVLLTLLGAVLWGVSGASVQFLSNYRDMNLEWLVTMRLITAGLLTVVYAWFKYGNAIFDIFRSLKDTLGLIVFGVFGMALCQYTYFKSIALAGAGIATVLQYLAPSMIIIYMLARYGKRPSKGEIISVILALVGTICLMGNDGFSMERFPLAVLVWGLLSARFHIYIVNLQEKHYIQRPLQQIEVPIQALPVGIAPQKSHHSPSNKSYLPRPV